MELIKPKEIVLKDMDDVEHTFTMSRLDFMSARAFGAQYMQSMVPKLGTYALNEEMMLKLMSFVSVVNKANNQLMRLETADLVRNHIPDIELGLLLEKEMIKYNFRFFQNGTASNFFAGIAQAAIANILETLTQSPAQSSTQEKPPLTS